MSPDDAEGIPGTLIGRGSTAEVRRLDGGRVLKLFKSHIPPQQVTTETEALARTHAAGLPVPRVHGTAAYGNRLGITLDEIEGSSALNRITRNPIVLSNFFARMAILQARVHALPGDGLPAQIEAIRTALDRAELPPNLSAQLNARLDGAPAGAALCHGDFHPGNLIEQRGALYLLDWDKACCGAPAADVARTAVMLRDGKLGGIADSPLADPVRDRLAVTYVRAYVRAKGGRTDNDDPAVDVRWWLPVMTAAKLPFVASARRNRVLRRLRREMA